MSELNKTPSANRLHITLFGKRNMGKSTLINALTSQQVAIVSAHPGTTTDPVAKAMEILPIGPCTLTDTAGLDDEGELGQLRVAKSLAVLKKTDIALLVITGDGFDSVDRELITQFKAQGIPFIVVINQQDVIARTIALSQELAALKAPSISVSAALNQGINELKQAIITHSPLEFEQPAIVGDLVSSGDSVLLVIPIDGSAPKGRIILPQMQVMRDLLDNNVIFHVCKPEQVSQTIAAMLQPPKLVITDSQAFAEVAAATPDNIALTSFSILYARYKGELTQMLSGVHALRKLNAGDKVLIAEACTHHCQSDDIGRVKIPGWISKTISPAVEFEFCTGRDYPQHLSEFKLVIHCGACNLNRREMLSRIESSHAAGVPLLNYGLCIAAMLGILERALAPFPALLARWQQQ